MSQLHVEAEATSRAAPEAVWALLADVGSYPDWGPWNASGLETAGDGTVVGAVRWLRYRHTTTFERILEVDDGRSLAYTVVRGLPVRNYRAVVTLTAVSDGTRIRWSATWDLTWPGRIVQRKLRTLYPEIVISLASAAPAAEAFPRPGHGG